eukprot:m.159344 g.159344  ORF g.159344 m.159344 type:complete len:373 (+) comp16490_c0_seq4:2829-3947(+)
MEPNAQPVDEVTVDNLIIDARRGYEQAKAFLRQSGGELGDKRVIILLADDGRMFAAALQRDAEAPRQLHVADVILAPPCVICGGTVIIGMPPNNSLENAVLIRDVMDGIRQPIVILFCVDVTRFEDNSYLLEHLLLLKNTVPSTVLESVLPAFIHDGSRSTQDLSQYVKDALFAIRERCQDIRLGLADYLAHLTESVSPSLLTNPELDPWADLSLRLEAIPIVDAQDSRFGVSVTSDAREAMMLTVLRAIEGMADYQSDTSDAANLRAFSDILGLTERDGRVSLYATWIVSRRYMAILEKLKENQPYQASEMLDSMRTLERLGDFVRFESFDHSALLGNPQDFESFDFESFCEALTTIIRSRFAPQNRRLDA